VLGPELVEQLTAASDASLGEQDASHFEDNVSSGSMILIDWDFFNSFVSPEPRRTPLRCFARLSLIPAILFCAAGLRRPGGGAGRRREPAGAGVRRAQVRARPHHQQAAPQPAALLVRRTYTARGPVDVAEQRSALPRHRDGRFWNDPASSTPAAMQVFLMFYLTDTSRENGCLRVVPGVRPAAQQSAASGVL